MISFPCKKIVRERPDKGAFYQQIVNCLKAIQDIQILSKKRRIVL
jgi:hypothetical protein